MDTTKLRKKLKIGDIVLVSSHASDEIPKIHVMLKKRVVVEEKKGRQIGLRRSMDWPGYSGWEAVAVYQDEIDRLRKEWSIPYTVVGEDVIFVYDDNIIKKARRNRNNNKQSTQKRKNNKVKKYVNKVN